MRILIIAIGRSGGTILNQWLALELRYKILNEPIWNKLSIEENDIVVKYNIGEIEKTSDVNLSNWDKIIGLIREDSYDTAISQYRGDQKNEWNCVYDVSDKWIKENHLNIKKTEEQIIKKIELIKQIKEIELLVTYEGIYNTKEDVKRIKDYVGISNTKYEHLLDNINRLRNRDKTKRKLL
jgi:hypothetical protein